MSTNRFDPNPYDIDPAVDPELERAIRDLDPADAELSAAQQERKAALLTQLLDAEAGAPPASVVPLRPRRRRVRWLVAAAAVSVLAGALVVTNSLGEDKVAYASWTADPKPLTGEIRTRAEAACRAEVERMAEPAPDAPDEVQPQVDLDSVRAVVAEQRGAYLFLSMSADDGSDVACFSEVKNPGKVTNASGGVATVGSPAPDTLAGDGVEIGGPGMMGGPEGGFAYLTGRVGADVAGITLHSGGQTIEATVSNGHVGAWWPYTLSQEELSNPSTVQGPVITVDVRLKDGTVLTDVPTGMSDGLPGPSEIGRVQFGGGVGSDGEVATAAGRVGDDVVGVTVVAPDGTRTEATVTDGTFSAEWPTDPSRDGVASQADDPTYDLTLRDGTVLTGQVPVSGYGSEARD